MSNSWLKVQELLSVKDLWCKAQGIRLDIENFVVQANLLNCSLWTTHGGWCGERNLKGFVYPISRHRSHHFFGSFGRILNAFSML